MSFRNIGLKWWKALGIAIASTVGFYPSSSIAQTNPNDPITPDGTLPNNSRVTLEGNTITITGGTQTGGNLFHSFKNFSVPTGSEAFFYNSADIQNIINRVTSGSISNIDGLIRANGSANLFLINPNGIVFGPNARLNVGGSFFATSANSMKFADGSEFSAKHPQTRPLLTIDVPIGLQFGANPGSIQVQRNARKAIDSPTIDEQNALQVQPGKTLGLVGGDINLEGVTLKSTGGRIELGSVAGNSLVSLTSSNPQWILGYQDVKNFRNIRLVDDTNILVSGDGKGSIAINANNIDIHSGSNMQAGIDANFQLSGTRAGDITLNASGVISINDGRIANEVQEKGIGNDGNINITARSLFLNNGTVLSTNSFGQGNTGSIIINAGDTFSFDGAGNSQETAISASLLGTGSGGKIGINAANVSVLNGATIVSHSFGRGNAGRIEISATDNILIRDTNSGVGSQVFSNSVGDGGTITLNAPKVSVLNGATIVAHTYAQGNAGDIIINAKKVLLDGVGSNGASSGLGSAAFNLVSGNGGAIQVNTDSLDVSNGATLFASSFGKKDAGSVTINATGAVSFNGIGANGFSSNAFSTVEEGSTGNGREIKITANSLSVKNGAVVGAKTSGQGNGGNISVNVNTLQLQGGGQIITTSRGSGDAGNISVNATESTTIIGSDKTFPKRLARIGRPVVRNEGAASGLFANTDISSTGSGGNINITTRRLSINEGALINASSQGNGVAGNINANTRTISLDNNASITADTQSINKDPNSPQANINIQSRDLILRRSSNITANATGEGVIGGDININTGVLAGFENSDITANSTDARGGNIVINVKGIFGMQFRESDSPLTSDITATGANNQLSGNVEINTLESDPTSALFELPVNLVDASNQIFDPCVPGGSVFENSFVSTGRGGLPITPTEPLQDTSTLSSWVRLKPQLSSRTNRKTTTRKTSSQPKKVLNPHKVETRNQIVEATGWIVDGDGNIEFVAQANQANPKSPWQNPASCSASK